MKLKLYLKTGLMTLAALLAFGVQANAQGNKQNIVTPQDYESATEADWISPAGTVSLKTGDTVYGKYASVAAGARGNRSAYKTVTFNDDVASGFTDASLKDVGYNVEFDFNLVSGNIANRSVSQLIIATKGQNLNNKNDVYSGSDYIFALSQPQRTATSVDETWYVNDLTNSKGSKVTLGQKTWYHLKLVVTATSVDYTITNNGETIDNGQGSFSVSSLPSITSIWSLVGRGTGTINFDNFEVYNYIAGQSADEPIISFNKVDGKNRIYTINFTEGNTLHYLLPGETAYKEVSTGNSVDVTATQSGKLYAYATNGNATSDTVSVDVDASEIALTTPTATFSNLNESNGLYHPTYTFASDNSKVLGTPDATLQATLDGEEVALVNGTYTFTKAGTLKVTATADGYTASEPVEVTVDNVNFIKDYTFDATQFTYSDSAEAVAKMNTINGVGSYSYAPSDCNYTLDDRITLGNNIAFAWAITAKKGLGLYTRVGKGTISYNIDDADLIEFTGANVVANGSNKSTSFAQYTLIPVINIYKVAPTTTSVTIDATSKLTSFSNASAVTLPENSEIVVYIATASDENTVTLKKVDTNVIPANTGVILYSKEAGERTLTLGGESTADFSENVLKAAVEPVVAGANDYALVKGQQAFAHVKEGVTIPAGKAYLETAAGSKLNISFDGTATDINSINADAAELSDKAPMFNLAGQRVNKSFKGVIIQNGKKFINK